MIRIRIAFDIGAFIVAAFIFQEHGKEGLWVTLVKFSLHDGRVIKVMVQHLWFKNKYVIKILNLRGK